MSHLTRAQTSYMRGYITAGADLAKIDQNLFLAINGDDGGTWTPNAEIIIGGAGFVFGAPSTIDGFTCTVFMDDANPIVFDRGEDDDYFGLTPTHLGARLQLTQTIIEVYSDNPAVNIAQIIETMPPADLSPSDANHVAAGISGASLMMPLRVYNGSKIVSVEFIFGVPATHANVPDVLPRFRVFAVDTAGTVILLRSLGALTQTDPDGYQEFYPRPASGASWQQNNVAGSGMLPYRFGYDCDVEHVVDTSKYSYFAQVIEESGTNSWTVAGNGNIYFSVNVICDSITIFDGRN